VQVDGREQKHWKIFSFEFKSAYVENIDSGGMWQRTPATSDVGPALFKGTLNINGQPKDTFIDMEVSSTASVPPVPFCPSFLLTLTHTLLLSAGVEQRCGVH